MRYNHTRTSIEISLERSFISPRVSLAIALICIAIYAVAIIVAAIRIHSSVVGQRVVAEQEFRALVAHAAVESSTLGFMTDQFQESFIDVLSLSKTLQTAIISSGTSEYTFEREREKAIVRNGGSSDFKFGFGVAKKTFSSSVDIENQRNITMRVSYNVLDRSFFISVLKQTLFIVLIGLCGALFTLLFRFLLVRDTVPVEKTGELFDGDEDPVSEITIPDEFLDVEPDEKDPDEPLIADISEAEFEGLLADSEIENEYAPFGLNWEANLPDKLEEELRRSVSFAQDLVLIAVEIQPAGDGEYQLLAEEALDFFVLQPLIFEHSDKGFFAIVPDSTIDDGFAKATEFRAYFFDKYPDLQQKISLNAGVSSRSDREISVDRLLIEAGAALEKATESSPVVAFRVDPEKYKEFMRKAEKS